MAKRKVTVTLDPVVLKDVDADAHTQGLNRSEYVERVLRHEHYRRLLASAVAPVPMTGDEQLRLRRLLEWQRNPRSDLPHASS